MKGQYEQMDNMDINEAQIFLEKEMANENYGVRFVQGVSLLDGLRLYRIETEMIVDGQKISADKVYAAWSKYLIATEQVTGEKITKTTKSGKEKIEEVPIQPDILTDKADDHIKKMYTWITTEYSSPYKSVVTKKEVNLLTLWIRFIVHRCIMENKRRKYIATGKGFADPKVLERINDMYDFRDKMDYTARVIHEKFESHKDRSAEDWEKRMAQDIIIGLYDLLRTDRLRLLPPVNPDDVPQIEGEDEAV